MRIISNPPLMAIISYVFIYLITLIDVIFMERKDRRKNRKQ